MAKYVFIIPSLSKGGAERVVSILASSVVSQGRESTIITHFIAESEYPVSNNVKIICLSGLKESEYRKKMSVIYLLKLAHRLRKVICNEKPDYILPFLWTTCIRVDIALFASDYKKRVIQTVRNNPFVFPESNIMKKYRDYLVKKSRLTIVQNKAQKGYFSAGLQKKIQILPNPVSNELLMIKRTENADVFKIIGVGRLEKQKNFKLLIDSVATVYKNNKNIRLDIYGEGSLKQELQKQIDLLGMTDVIRLQGRSNDYNEIYSTASVFVLSSNFEGMPNTLLEAMAVGLPCISTNCPTGPSDIIQDCQNGFLIDIGSKKDLSEKIELLMKNSDLREKLGKCARETIINEYTPLKISQQFINICE